jgi:hypothetical protein
MNLTITYELTGAGWALTTFEYNFQKVEIRVSYLYDSLYELASSALYLMRYQSTFEEVFFMEEPGEYQLVINRTDSLLNLTMLKLNPYPYYERLHRSSDEPVKLFEYEVPVKKYAMEVLNLLYKLYQTWGLEGYKSEWVKYDFPYEKYLLLEKAIKSKGVVDKKTKQ